MSIIYSYPEQGVLNANDTLIGTSAELVGGKQKNITRNFSIQQIADFINNGTGIVDPVATDFQIAVFNQGGTKLTGSIISQDSSPSNGVAGTGITIAGSLTTTGNIITNANLSAFGVVTLGSQNNLISLNSTTKLGGPIQDSTGTLGNVNQILLSNGTGNLSWQNYAAGLTYQGVWNANTNNPTLIGGTGINGHFYIVDVAGSTNLDGITDWKVGDWAVFVESGATDTWQKIDNSSELTGSGTVNTLAMFTADKVLGDSLISQAGAVVSVNASLKVRDTVEATSLNTNLKLKGAGTGGVEVMSADGVTDGKIQLNCSVGTHGVTIQSPPHANNATYTLILPSSVGTVGQVLTSAGSGAGAQLTWSSPTVGTVTNFTAVSTAILGITTVVTNPTTTPTLTLSITGAPGSGLFLDGTGNWSSPGGGVTDIIATAPLNADVATGSVTLSMPAYATATGGYVPSGGATGQYLDGLSGNWTTLPVSGVTSVSGTNNRISVTGGNTAVVDAVIGTVNSSSITLATGQQIQAAIDLALSGALVFKGTFNAATGAIDGGSTFLYQVTAGGAFDSSAARVAVSVGDFYIANVAGNFYGTSGTAMGVGDEAIATTAYAADASVLLGWSVVPTQSSGGTVTGTGAATQVTFWDAASNINGDTAFNWDNTNKRLGIGTVSPDALLDIESPNVDTARIRLGCALDGTWAIGNILGSLDFFSADTSGPGAGLRGSVSMKAEATTGEDMGMAFATYNNTERMRIAATGNVGIGTLTPISGFRLDVVGGDLRVADDATNGFEAGYSAGGSSAFIQGYNRATNVFIDMLINNSVTVKANGNVGIGTTIPAVSLDVSATDAVQMPKGTTAQRAAGVFTSANGMLRYNTDDNGFEGYIDNAWGAIGGAGGGASEIITGGGSGDGTTTSFPLGGTPSGGTKAFVDVFIDGVYQNESTYGISGTNVTISPAPPTGTTIQTKTTTGSNSGAAVTSVNGMTGSVLLSAPTLVTNNISAVNGGLYIFATATAYTLTLPTAPSAGDSIKISNGIGGAANIIAPGSKKIMNVAGNMTINTPTAAFEMIFSGDANGWIIIGNI